MISYHLLKANAGNPRAYWRDYKSNATDDLARIASIAQQHVWSPIVWRDGIRAERCFVASNWCVLDFDNGELSLAEAKETFCDMIHFIGTTKSHQKMKHGLVCDRFRVALKFERVITSLRQYKYAMHMITKKYPADPSCKDGARFFYPCPEIVQMFDGDDEDGYTVDVPDEPPETFDRPRPIEIYRTGQMPPWADSKLKTVWPPHTRNTTVYGLAKDLTKYALDVDEIEAMIIDSPTYAGAVSRDLLDEIRKTIRNGRKKALTEIADSNWTKGG